MAGAPEQSRPAGGGLRAQDRAGLEQLTLQHPLDRSHALRHLGFNSKHIRRISTFSRLSKLTVGAQTSFPDARVVCFCVPVCACRRIDVCKQEGALD